MPGGERESMTLYPREASIRVDQILFNGFRTANGVRQAEAQVLGGREALRNLEQTVLLDAATAYMAVLRDTAILDLQRNNVEVLQQQLAQTQHRFGVGEITRTDVAQAEARLSAGRAQTSLAEANLRASVARYRQIIGTIPGTLAPGMSVDRLLPKTPDAAVQIALAGHPGVMAALHGLDAAELEVKMTEGELYPSVGLTGAVSQRYDMETRGDSQMSASMVARLTVPIYEGGEVYARTRQAKETAGQRRIEAEIARNEVRAAVLTAWGVFEAASAQIAATRLQIQSSEVALAGVREEARVGQRTTLEVLNAQQELLNARIALVIAQRDRVVGSYALLAAIGRLSAATLGLPTRHYEPRRHFDQVKDLWIGVRTPDGR